MPEPLIVKIPHKLGKEEALRRIKPALSKASSSFPMLVVEEEAWSADRMTFRVRALGKWLPDGLMSPTIMFSWK
jgi:hypothetical protein